MTRDEIIRGLRCSASTEPLENCKGCRYLTEEELEGETLTACDVDQIAIDAADLLGNDARHILALQREVELKRAQLECAESSAGMLRKQNEELRNAAALVTRMAGDAAVGREWVSVKERLPEDPVKKVLIFVPHAHGNIVDTGRYLGADGWVLEGWYLTQTSVTHWMPLPKPPEEGEHG